LCRLISPVDIHQHTIRPSGCERFTEPDEEVLQDAGDLLLRRLAERAVPWWSPYLLEAGFG
jgi:hypothetical protein